MSKVVLEDVNNSLERFNELSEEFKVSKAEVVENLPMLQEAVSLFERLKELYYSVDPDSPRAKNYYDMAQSLASIDQGWRYNRDLLSNEAILADHAKAPIGSRLSLEERDMVRSLIGSSKLQNFVQFLDMENPDAFNTLSKVVSIETNNQDLSLLSPKDWMSKRTSMLVSSLFNVLQSPTNNQNVPKVVPDEEVVPDEGVVPDEDDSLVEYVSKQSNKESQEKAIAEITETSKSIDEALREKRPVKTKSKSTRKSSKPYKPDQNWGDAFKQIAKWLAAAAATFAGVGFLSKKILDIVKDIKWSKEAMESSVNNFTSKRKSDETEDASRWKDKEAAGKDYREALEDLKKEWPTLFKGISSKDIGLLQSYAANQEATVGYGVMRDLTRWLSTTFEGKSEEQINMLAAIFRGDRVFWHEDKNGNKFGINLDPFVKSPKGQEVSDAALAARALDASQSTRASQPYEMDGSWVDKTFRSEKVQESKEEARNVLKLSGAAGLEASILMDPDKVNQFMEKIRNDVPLVDESTGIQLVTEGEPTPTLRMVGELFEAKGKQSILNWRERKISKAAKSGDREELYKQIKRYANIYAEGNGGLFGRMTNGGASKFLGYDISTMESAKPLLDAIMELGDYGTLGGYESYMRKHNSNYSGKEVTSLPPTMYVTKLEQSIQDSSNRSEPIGEL